MDSSSASFQGAELIFLLQNRSENGGEGSAKYCAQMRLGQETFTSAVSWNLGLIPTGFVTCVLYVEQG